LFVKTLISFQVTLKVLFLNYFKVQKWKLIHCYRIKYIQMRYLLCASNCDRVISIYSQLTAFTSRSANRTVTHTLCRNLTSALPILRKSLQSVLIKINSLSQLFCCSTGDLPNELSELYGYIHKKFGIIAKVGDLIVRHDFVMLFDPEEIQKVRT
jgi:hypothetical protein